MTHPRLSIPPDPPADAAGPAVFRPRRTSIRRRLVEIGGLVGAPEAQGDVLALAEAIRSKQPRRAASAASGRNRGGKQGRDESLESGIARLIDRAEAAAPDDEPLLVEAAAWALGRAAARDGVGGGSTGRLLERILSMAAGRPTQRDPGEAWNAGRLVMARVFADVESCRRLEAAVADAFLESVGAFMRPTGVSGDGSPSILRRVEAWARLAGIADETGGRPWGAAADEALDTALAFALRLLGPSGRGLAAAGPMRPVETRWLLDRAAASGSKAVRQAARRLREQAEERRGGSSGRRSGSRRGGGRSPKHKAAGKPPVGLSLESANRVVLRSDWSAEALRVFLDAGGAGMRLEVAAGSRLLLDGPWECEIRFGGETLSATGPWEHTAHETETAATFVEFARPLQGGLRLERQVVLLHDDRCLLLADAVVPESAARPLATPAARPLCYAGGLTVAEGLELEQPRDSVEVAVRETVGRKGGGLVRGIALPLGIGEWKRTDPSGHFGPLAKERGRRLELEQRAEVGRLCAAIWLGCVHRQTAEPVTWRQLTVADTRQNLPRHRACGYRVRVGLSQWLVYRSLDAARNRTVLGCNVSCEFLLGRIRKDGSVERLIEIQ